MVCCQLPKAEVRSSQRLQTGCPLARRPGAERLTLTALSAGVGGSTCHLLTLPFTTLDGGRVVLSVVVAVQHFELYTKNGYKGKFYVLYTLP